MVGGLTTLKLNMFFRVEADSAATSRWYLKAPVDEHGSEVDPRLFTQGVRVNPQPVLRLPLRRPGDEVDFNFCDFDMVVVAAALNAELEQLSGARIQRFPVVVESSKVAYEILNVCELVSCLDEKSSLFTRWIDSDGRPEKVGQLRMVADLRIDPSAAGDRHIFRVAGWPIALIISEEVKSLLERRRVTGLQYERVG